MSTFRATSQVRAVDAGIFSRLDGRRHTVLVLAMVGGAWLIAVVAQATGNAAALHHHALIEDGPPLWLAVPIFLVGWQVMVVAMMLPASLPALGTFEAASRSVARPTLAIAVFLGAYSIAWTAFGLVAFMGDFVLHHFVDVTPWLAQRPWLIEAGVVGLAGAYQFAPLKRRSLEACRDPRDHVAIAPLLARGAFRLGLRHALTCLASSWALMLVMFAAGFANLGSMAILTGLMTYEVTGRHGARSVAPAGVVLILAALTTLSGPSLGAA
jgi:predicted metal-binding membrane protein